MKRLFTVTVIAILAITVLGNAVFAVKYTNGEYVGVVKDEQHGDTVIAVAIWNGHIVNVEIINQIKHEYSYAQGKEAYLKYPYQVMEKQAGNIDVIAGATSSYSDYNTALEMALQQAAGTYKGNVFYGLSRDYGHGHVLVEVTLNKARDKIEAVKFITANPDKKMASREALMAAKTDSYPYPAGIEAFKTFPTKVLKAQSVHVDGVAGATHSNHAYEEALKNALTAAGALGNFE